MAKKKEEKKGTKGKRKAAFGGQCEFVDAVILPIDISKDKHVIVIDMGTQATRVDAYNQDLHRCYHQVFPNEGLLIPAPSKKNPNRKKLNNQKLDELCGYISFHLDKIREHYPADHDIPITMAGTEILRNLPDKDQERMQRQIKKRCGVELRVLTGLEEVELYAEAIRLFWPHANGRVVHLGHGSFDIAEMNKDGKIVKSATFPHGMYNPVKNFDDIFADIRPIKQGMVYYCGKVLRIMFRHAYGEEAIAAMEGTEKSFLFSAKSFAERSFTFNHLSKKDSKRLNYPRKMVNAVLGHDKAQCHIVVSRGMREALAARLFDSCLGIKCNPASLYVPKVQTPVTDAHNGIPTDEF